MALRKKVQELTDRVSEALGNIGISCQGGSDTFHDNFEHEQGQRISAMWSVRAKELNDILRQAEVVSVGSMSSDEVTIGKSVTVLDEDSGVTGNFKIGSYMNFQDDAQEEVVSYVAPLAKIVMFAKVGEIREGQIGSERKRLKIVAIK